MPKITIRKQPERACIWKDLLPLGDWCVRGRVEKQRGIKVWYVSLKEAPKSLKGWLRYTWGSLVQVGPQVLQLMHATEAEPPDFRGSVWITTLSQDRT